MSIKDKNKKRKHGIIVLSTIINDFAHDLFTGLWISSLLVIFLLHSEASSVAAVSEACDVIHSVMKTFFWLGTTSLSLIVATGIIRLRYYGKQEERTPEAIKTRALIVKHVILGALFLIGTYLSYHYVYR